MPPSNVSNDETNANPSAQRPKYCRHTSENSSTSPVDSKNKHQNMTLDTFKPIHVFNHSMRTTPVLRSRVHPVKL